MRHSKQRGFTLIELIVVLVLMSVLSITVSSVYIHTVDGFSKLRVASELVDEADLIQKQILRDLRSSLPNSIRLTTSGNKKYIEYIPIITSGRYKAAEGSVSSSPCPADNTGISDNDILSIGMADTCFISTGLLVDTSAVTTAHSLIIFNTGDTAQTNAYSGGNRAAIQSATDITNGTKIIFSSNTFSYGSEQQRFYIVSTPITYECDIDAHTLKRHTGYGFNGAQPTVFVGGSLLSVNVGTCEWTYSTITNLQKAMTTFKLGLINGDTSIMLVHSAQMENRP